LILGRIVPALLACLAFGALTACVVAVAEQGWQESSASSVFFVVIAALSAWLLWKVLRTAWLVILADETFTCVASGGRWSFGPGEIIAVRGDVYHQFLHLVSVDTKVIVWAQLDDRDGFFSAIRRANPAVEFAPWIQSTSS